MFSQQVVFQLDFGCFVFLVPEQGDRTSALSVCKLDLTFIILDDHLSLNEVRAVPCLIQPAVVKAGP
jgi:hypothetical protein